MNGHFSAVGDGPNAQDYEHGIQVIDEDKEFKYAMPLMPLSARHEPRRVRRRRDTTKSLTSASLARTSMLTSSGPTSPSPASITT